MRFRPCIDLHNGKVKQIVGSSLRDSGEAVTNFVSEQPPAYYADLYYKDNLPGGHVIMLGPNNETAAREEAPTQEAAPAQETAPDPLAEPGRDHSSYTETLRH